MENPPLVDLPGAEQPVMAKHDGPSTVPSVGMLEPMDDLIYFSEDEEDAKGKKQATEAANSPVTGVENVEQHLAGVTIEEGSAAE